MLLNQGQTVGDARRSFHISVPNYCGIRSSDDTLPERLLPPLKNGSAANQVSDLDDQLKEC